MVTIQKCTLGISNVELTIDPVLLTPEENFFWLIVTKYMSPDLQTC